MKKTIIALMLIIMSTTAWATAYVVGPGDELGSVGLDSYDTLSMTGGQIEDLNLGGWSTGVIEDTNPIIGEGDGGIWLLNVSAYSELAVEGGEIQFLTTDDYSTTHLYGGQILGDLTVQDPTAWVHIYGYGFGGDSSQVTGYWAGGVPFSIDLVDDTISTYGQINFHTIPEPATMLLFAAGAVMLRKKHI